jgi:hypothetical protein
VTVVSAARTLAGALCWEEARDDEGGHQTQQAAPAEVVRGGVLRDERLAGRAEQHAAEHPQPQLPLWGIAAAGRGGSYVLTTGTGSGKSLAYFIPIVDAVLCQGPRGARRGIAAIVVYPMNALCNSQMGELTKFLRRGYGPGQEPVTFARYTGQETEDERKATADRPPDILLTNYMMLELLLTRMDPNDERVIAAVEGLRFLVLDELHTYCGRQGADVAMLVRRVRERCGAPTLRCIGTSATMAASGTREERAAQVSAIASRLFGDHVAPENVIGETLRRAMGPADESAPCVPSPVSARHSVRRRWPRWRSCYLSNLAVQ